MKSIIPFVIKIITSAIAIYTNMLLAKLLGLQYYGVFNSMLSVVFVIGLITDWGFSSYGAQLLAQKITKEEKILFINHSFSFRIILSVFFSLCYAIFCYLHFKQDIFYYLCGIPIILFNFLNPEWICRGIFRPDLASYRQFFFTLLNLASYFVIYKFLLPKYLSFLLYSANTLISYFIIIRNLRNVIHFNFIISTEWRELKLFFNKTSIFFLGYLVNNVFYTLGIIFLALFVSNAETGIYSSYYTLFSTLTAPIVITYTLFSPKVNELSNIFFWNKYFKVILNICLAGTVVLLFGEKLYSFFYPKEFVYKQEYNFLTVGIFICFCFEALFILTLIINNRPKLYFRLNLLGLCINLTGLSIIMYTNVLNAYNALFTLLSTQVIIIILAFILNKGLLKYLLNYDVIAFLICTCIIVIAMYLNIPIVYYATSILGMIYAAVSTVYTLRKLY